jgi:hypothetical protein
MKPSDEFRHEAENGVRWQENYVWHCWDAQRNCGWFLHLGRMHDEGMIDVRALVMIDGKATSATFQVGGDDCFGAPGLDVKVDLPLEKMRIRFDGKGAVGTTTDGFHGVLAGNIPFGFDVEMISDHPVVDWGVYTTNAGIDPLIAGNHYEQGARWRGKLWGAGKEIEAEGLLIRDHSWGPRQWQGKWWGLWLPMVFDGGRRFISGTAMADNGVWMTFTVLSDSNGVVNVSYDNWFTVTGPFVPRQYSSAQVLRMGDDFTERYEYEGHAVLAFMRHSSFLDAQGRPIKRGITDMYSTVLGEGKVGFANLQHTVAVSVVEEGFNNPAERWAE